MDSSKLLSGTEECSSSESGWTMYIASPDKEYDHADDEDDDVSIGKHSYKKDAQEDADSDDSMASDASSGPSAQGNIYHAGNRDERKYVAKKHNQQEEKKKHHEQKKAEKDKPGNRANSAGRFKKF